MSSTKNGGDAQVRLVLELVDGEAAPAELPRSGVLTIGSSKERADFHVDGQGVADVHCAIGRTKGGGWAVKDLGSEHGTRVNGETVQAARVRAGDELLVGSRRLRIVDPAAVNKTSKKPSKVEPPSSPKASGATNTKGKGQVAPKLEETSIHTVPRIAGFRIVRPLGRGGMGSVYLGVQESLDREVALKVLSHRVEADSEFVRRFQAEARAAAALNHPNVVTVYDVGETDGVHYLAMEYMDAGNLETRVARSGPLAADEALRVLRDAASGLVFAEAKGIVHRDIKPANLMQNRSGTTKIADLGLATHVDAEEAPEGKKVFGTPHFMSPEQARGERLDPRSDLYSLGATAYRLLSGKTPFEGASSREILRAHLRDEATPLNELVPSLPAELGAVVAKLMRKDPAERFGSASELLRELERVSGAAPGAALLTGAKSPRLALAVIPLVLLAAGAGAWWYLAGNKSSIDAGHVDGAPETVDADTDTPSNTVGAPPLDDLPPLPNETGVEGGSEDAPDEDSDTALKLREAEAKLAFMELESKALTPAERRDELRQLAATYDGTTAAHDALTDAERLDEEIRRADDQAKQATERSSALLGGLRRALGGVPAHRPVDAFLALDAVLAEVVDTEELTGDSELAASVQAIEQSVIDDAVEHARTTLDTVEAACERGAFEEVLPALDDLALTFTLPEGIDQRGLTDLDRLAAQRDRADEIRGSLDNLRKAYAERVAAEDAVVLATAVRERTTAQIASLDLSAASATLRSEAQKLRGEEPRGFATRMADDLDRAAAIFHTLADEFGGVGWRRTKVTDPRERGRATHETVGADHDGLMIDVGGTTKTLPFSAFADNTKELHRLFNDRLARSWTDEERDAIASLMRIAAVSEALAVTAPLLVPGGRRSVLQRELGKIDDAFETAALWSQGGEAERLGRERDATRILTEVIQATLDERWSEAASGTEALLADYRDTLLVRSLSDGSGAAAPPHKEFVELPGSRPADDADDDEQASSDEDGSGSSGSDGAPQDETTGR